MKIYKKKTVKVVDQILCDCCGQSCSNEYDHEFAAIEAKWGYWAKQDGTVYDIQICETCFTEVLDFIKDKRRKILGPVKYPYDADPLEGRCYFTS